MPACSTSARLPVLCQKYTWTNPVVERTLSRSGSTKGKLLVRALYSSLTNVFFSAVLEQHRLSFRFYPSHYNPLLLLVIPAVR